MATERKLLVYIASSLDGYIAKPGDDLSFLSMVEKEGEDYGYSQFIATIDTVILGRKTYEWVMKHAPAYVHADKKVYVITHTARPAIGTASFYTGNLKELVLQLKSEEGKHIFCDGGAEVIHALLQDDLIDEMTLSILPVLVGGGTRLFKEGRPEQQLILIACRSFDTGLVQLQYKRDHKPQQT